MKYLVPAIIFMLHCTILEGQDPYTSREGKVSYTTTQYIYVRFPSTNDIAPGDTLYYRQDSILMPVLTVKELSSISCVCIPISAMRLSVGDGVVSKQKARQPENNKAIKTVPGTIPTIKPQDSVVAKKGVVEKRKQLISGNISAASYLNFSDVTSASQRMKYNFSMVIRNIGSSRLSAETYISFAHKLDDWSSIQDDIFNGLKIYSLALDYEINKRNTLWFGRKINPRISNAGAIDGLQYELKAGSFTVGLFGGTRPDYQNYSFNPDLLQFGGYLGHDLAGKNGSMQTTVAFIEQMNNGMVDRRFAYLQHTNSLLRNLYFFGSMEVDLYKKTMNPVDSVLQDTTYKKDNSPVLSNLYVSLRYRPVRKLSLSLSYSARQNVIYYETYKSLVDRLLEAATVQGFIFQVSYQPIRLLSVGVNAGYRDNKNDPRSTKNLYCYVTYSQLPVVRVATTISATLLETGYMSGQIYSLGISRDLVAAKLSAGLNYRYVSYKFHAGEPKLIQNMAELNFTWRILKKLSCGLYYEGTFDKNSMFNRLYMNITQRF